MRLNTRNERVLYAALEKVARASNAQLANLIIDSAIVQADNETPHHPKTWVGFNLQVAECGLPQRDDL